MEDFFTNLFSVDSQANIQELIVSYGLKLVGALLTFLIGWWIIAIICSLVGKVMVKKEVDASLRGFVNSLLNVTLKILLAITCISMLGVEMTSFIAILGAAGLAIGMALSGTLQNFAGGVMILIFRPIKLGEYIEAAGHAGVVSEIQIFVTILTTPDNKTIIIPNGPLSNGSLVNYSRQEKRRVDFTFSIAYGHDFNHARGVLQQVIDADDRILKNDGTMIALSEMADSSVNIACRVWVKTSDYWTVYFDMNEKVYVAFNENNISIPFPQIDVHLDR